MSTEYNKSVFRALAMNQDWLVGRVSMRFGVLINRRLDFCYGYLQNSKP